MLLQITNSALLLCLISLSLTGVATLVSSGFTWVLDVHRFSAWALIVLVPTKGLIIFRSLKRGLAATWDRGALPLLSSLMAGMVLLALAFGVAWPLRINDWWVVLNQTVISWHWIVGLAILPLLLVHAWTRWPKPSARVLLSRRAALRGISMAAGGLLGWQAVEALARQRQDPMHPRRLPTGSRRFGAFQANAFPVTTNYGEKPRQLLEQDWRLSIGGTVDRPILVSYEELQSMPQEVWTATLDCTVGWYTTQHWRGVPLAKVLELARPQQRTRFFRLKGDTGYSKSFTWRERGGVLLALEVGDERLAHQHGFPLRAVIPSRRGWFWVKWLTEVQLFSNDGR